MITLEVKKRVVKEIENLANNYPVIGILDLTSMPSRQLQRMRRNLEGKAIIKVARKRLIERALKNLKKNGVEKLLEFDSAQPAMIFSKLDSFKLFKIIKENKSPAPAKPNVVSPKDIVIEAGPTEFPPGPMISEFNKIGLKTKVESGKIVISESKVVVKKGEVIKKEVSDVLNKLGIEPLEIGLDLKGTFENGVIFSKDVLDIDEEEYLENIKKVVRDAFNLTVNIGYPTDENIEFLIIKAFNECRNLSLELEIPSKETIEDLILLSYKKMKSLENIIHK